MGMRILEGRAFTEGERDVVVVSESFARKRKESVVGRLLYPPGTPDPAPHLVVGVVNDVAYMGLANDTIDQPAVYRPGSFTASTFYRFIVRTDGDPAEVIAGARRRLAEIDPTVPVLAPQTGPDELRRQTAQHRFVAVLLGGIAIVGALLAMSGVYGAVALAVRRRSREIGVRMALGASASRLMGAVLLTAMKPVGGGALAGIGAAAILAPQAEALLFKVSPRDPLSGLLVLALVMATAALAALCPARRVSRVDPASTLRSA
jgi:ABC-type antimicrobial peptide transport system permease subunit